MIIFFLRYSLNLRFVSRLIKVIFLFPTMQLDCVFLILRSYWILMAKVSKSLKLKDQTWAGNNLEYLCQFWRLSIIKNKIKWFRTKGFHDFLSDIWDFVIWFCQKTGHNVSESCNARFFFSFSNLAFTIFLWLQQFVLWMIRWTMLQPSHYENF